MQCPYHGWQYDGDGNCRRIPSLGKDAKIPGRTRIDAYPTVEQYGLVFAFLGDLPDAERPPIMPIPEYGPNGPMEGWAATIQYFEFDIDYKRSIEINPRHRGAHEYIGEAYLMVNDLPNAEKHLAMLRSICLLQCEELADLEKAVVAYKAKRE